MKGLLILNILAYPRTLHLIFHFKWWYATFSLTNLCFLASYFPHRLQSFETIKSLWSAFHLKIFKLFFIWCNHFCGLLMSSLYSLLCYIYFCFQRVLFVQRQILISQCYFPGMIIYKNMHSLFLNWVAFRLCQFLILTFILWHC